MSLDGLIGHIVSMQHENELLREALKAVLERQNVQSDQRLVGKRCVFCRRQLTYPTSSDGSASWHQQCEQIFWDAYKGITAGTCRRLVGEQCRSCDCERCLEVWHLIDHALDLEDAS